MRRNYLLIVCFCFSFLNASSQIDSLRYQLSIAQRNKNIPAISSYEAHIGWAFLSEGKYDSALKYFHRSLHTSKDDLKLVASNFNSLGIIYNQKGVPDSAVHFYGEALQLYNEMRDTTEVLTIENNLAIIYKNQGLFERALQTAFSALKKLEHMPPGRTLASSYNTLGSVYAKMEEPELALQYYRKALHVRKTIQFEKGIGQSYNNIGETFIFMKRYDSALVNLLKSLEIKKAFGEKGAMGSTFNSIGVIYLKQKRFAEAEHYLTQAVKHEREADERVDQAVSLNNLADVKISVGDLKQAENCLTTANLLIRQTEAINELQRNLELRIKLYKSKNDLRKALGSIEELVVVKDSLLTSDKIRSLLSLRIQFETEKKEQQIHLLQNERSLQEAQIKTHQQWLWTLVITIFLLIVVVVLVYINFRLTRRNKEGVEMLLKELHHRVKNNLQLLSSIFSLQSQELQDEKAIQAVRSSEARINAMALIHRKLYNVDQNRSINIREYVNELVQYLVYSYGYNDKHLNLSVNLEDVLIDVDKAIPLGLIMNELISNSFKYAYNGNPEPRLNIHTQVIDNHLHIHLGDNGKGIQEVKMSENDSFGLKMVGTFIRQLRGSMEVKTDSGTKYVLEIPLQ